MLTRGRVASRAGSRGPGAPACTEAAGNGARGLGLTDAGSVRPREEAECLAGQRRAPCGRPPWPVRLADRKPGLSTLTPRLGADTRRSSGREVGMDREHTSRTNGAALSGGSEVRPGASAPRRGQKTLCGGAWCGPGTRSIFLECGWMCREAGAAPRRATQFRGYPRRERSRG